MSFFYYPEEMRGNLIAAGRTLLGWTQSELVSRAGVAKQTVTDLEHEKGNPTKSSKRKIVQALEAAGVEFVETDGKIGVFLRLPPVED